MRPDKIHQILNKLPPFHLLMHIDTSGLRNQKTEPFSLRRHADFSQCPLHMRPKTVQTHLHLLRRILTPEKVVQRGHRIIKPYHFRPESQLRLLLLHQIDQILFQSAKSHPVPFSFFLRLHIKYIRNITEQLANLKMLRTYLLALSALDTIRRFSVVPCMDPIIDI